MLKTLPLFLWAANQSWPNEDEADMLQSVPLDKVERLPTGKPDYRWAAAVATA